MKFIPIAQPILGGKEAVYVNKCLRTTWISSTGEFIDKFETSFAQKFGSKYAISCSNGTTALHLALLALGIGPGDEVILPVLTFVASANAISFVGAKPVFVDVEADTWNIDGKQIASKISRKTKAIMPVHLYGYPTNMRLVSTLAKKHNLFVIEDAAEAHGAKYANKYVGTFGDIGCFSFYGNKVITSGEGGMILTNNGYLAQRIRLYKNHGQEPHKKYWHPVIGYNYRLTNLQAAIGLAQLENMDKYISVRKKIEKWYRQYLQKIPDITFPPQSDETYQKVNWLFTVLVKTPKGKSRDRLLNYLKSKNIDSRPVFYPITQFPMYASPAPYPNAEKISRYGITLPTFVALKKEQVKYIARCISAFLA